MTLERIQMKKQLSRRAFDALKRILKKKTEPYNPEEQEGLGIGFPEEETVHEMLANSSTPYSEAEFGEEWMNASRRIGESAAKQMEDSVFEHLLNGAGEQNISNTATTDMPTLDETKETINKFPPPDPELLNPIEMTQREYEQLKTHAENDALLRGEQIRTTPLTPYEALFAIPIKIVEPEYNTVAIPPHSQDSRVPREFMPRIHSRELRRGWLILHGWDPNGGAL